MNKTTDRNPNFAAAVEIVEPWATAFRNAGLVSPVTDEPSIQALSRASKVHPSAISRIISGRTKNPHIDTVEAMAKGLEVPPIQVASWIGQQWVEHKPWTPPKEASLLSSGNRDLVENLIRALVSAQSEQKEK